MVVVVADEEDGWMNVSCCFFTSIPAIFNSSVACCRSCGADGSISCIYADLRDNERKRTRSNKKMERCEGAVISVNRSWEPRKSKSLDQKLEHY